MDANRRLFVGGTPSLKVRMGEDAKDWEREESEGAKKGFMRSGGGFEVEALALITRGDGSSKSRLADYMSREQRDASWLFASSTHTMHSYHSQISRPLPLGKMTGDFGGEGRVTNFSFFVLRALPNIDIHCSHPLHRERSMNGISMVHMQGAGNRQQGYIVRRLCDFSLE